MTKKCITLGELARELGGELTGDCNLTVSDIKDTEEAGEGDVAFIFGKKFEKLLEKTKASVCVVPEGIKKTRVPTIKCENPNLAFKKAVDLILPGRIFRPQGIHKTVSIAEDVTLGEGVSIGASTVVGKGVKIGKDSIIYPNVTICENVKIGERVIIHPGCVIGSDGFGYERTQNGYEKMPHIGGVIIEDDVELGASVTVDRAKIAHTKIGRGTKVDNLVHIAHNVTIGKNCIIVAQCGISGSAKIGNNVIIGGQVGITEHVEIGDNVMIAARAAVIKDVPPGTIMWGIPARPLKKAKTIYALFDKLPEIYKRLKAVEEKLETKDHKK